MELPINKIIQCDCIEEMKKLSDNSVDAIITDPPYGLEFMGKEWDKFKETGNSSLMYGTEEEGVQGVYGKEKEQDYIKIAESRIKPFLEQRRLE